MSGTKLPLGCDREGAKLNPESPVGCRRLDRKLDRKGLARLACELDGCGGFDESAGDELAGRLAELVRGIEGGNEDELLSG